MMSMDVLVVVEKIFTFSIILSSSDQSLTNLKNLSDEGNRPQSNDSSLKLVVGLILKADVSHNYCLAILEAIYKAR